MWSITPPIIEARSSRCCASSGRRRRALTFPYFSPKLTRPCHAFGEKNVRLANAIRVGHDADDPEAESEIKLVRMPFQVSNVPNGAWKVGVEVNGAQAGLVILVVTARPQRDRALPAYDIFEVPNQCPADTSTPVLCRYNQWMDFPDMAGIHRNSADPTDHAARFVNSDAADPAFFQRFEDLLPSRVEIVPTCSSVVKGVVKKRRRAIDHVRAIGGEVKDVHGDFSTSAASFASDD